MRRVVVAAVLVSLFLLVGALMASASAEELPAATFVAENPEDSGQTEDAPTHHTRSQAYIAVDSTLCGAAGGAFGPYDTWLPINTWVEIIDGLVVDGWQLILHGDNDASCYVPVDSLSPAPVAIEEVVEAPEPVFDGPAYEDVGGSISSPDDSIGEPEGELVEFVSTEIGPAYTNADGVRCRAYPVDGNVLHALPVNTEVVQWTDGEQDGWQLVAYQGTQCYISASFLSQELVSNTELPEVADGSDVDQVEAETENTSTSTEVHLPPADAPVGQENLTLEPPVGDSDGTQATWETVTTLPNTGSGTANRFEIEEERTPRQAAQDRASNVGTIVAIIAAVGLVTALHFRRNRA